MKGIIYKLEIGDYYYYGSTKQSFEERMLNHQLDLIRKKHKIPLYICIEEHGGWKNVKTHNIKEIEVETLKDIRKEEQSYIKEFIKDEKCLNCISAFRSEEELIKYRQEYNKAYRISHKEQIEEYNKIYSVNYYIENKDIINQKHKEYRETHKEKIKQYYEDNKEYKLKQMKEYKEAHKEEYKEYMKKYREANREKYRLYMIEYHARKRLTKEHLIQ
jgi:hypothetical protein